MARTRKSRVLDIHVVDGAQPRSASEIVGSISAGFCYLLVGRPVDDEARPGIVKKVDYNLLRLGQER